jgi:stage II sporulation protein P
MKYYCVKKNSNKKVDEIHIQRKMSIPLLAVFISIVLFYSAPAIIDLISPETILGMGSVLFSRVIAVGDGISGNLPEKSGGGAADGETGGKTGYGADGQHGVNGSAAGEGSITARIEDCTSGVLYSESIGAYLEEGDSISDNTGDGIPGANREAARGGVPDVPPADHNGNAAGRETGSKTGNDAVGRSGANNNAVASDSISVCAGDGASGFPNTETDGVYPIGDDSLSAPAVDSEHSVPQAKVEGIIIKNETSILITSNDIKTMMVDKLDLNMTGDGPRIVIYHTHSSEGYLKKMPVDDGVRYTDDDSRNVINSGKVLREELSNGYSLEALHDRTKHDEIFSQAYSASLNTIQNFSIAYDSIGIFIDVHRDGKTAGEGRLRTAVNIDGMSVAKIMFVVGSDERLKHDGWKENLKFAVKLQKKLQLLYPGITKPVFISNNRYNQHISNGALLVEIGGDGDTAEEASEAAKCLAKALSEVLKENGYSSF